MMDGDQSWTKNFYKVFSSREKKLLAELFGPGVFGWLASSGNHDLGEDTVALLLGSFR